MTAGPERAGGDPIAVVAGLWRFPVKSMAGQPVEEVRVDARGVHADRLWAVRDLEKGMTASARRIPALLRCSARYAREPGPGTGPGNVPDVVITFPDGAECSSADPAVHGRLSELAGREVRLTALAPAGDTRAHRLSVRQSAANFSVAEVRRDFGLSESEELPDTTVFSPKQVLTLARYSTPPGAFVDLAPVHLLSVQSLTSLSPDGSGYDVRRFRPNVVVDIGGAAAEFPETAWIGGDVQLGSAVLRVTTPTIRCVVPTRPQPGLELDKALTRVLAERTDRFLGVYADVTRTGRIRVGDPARVDPPARVGPARRAADAVGKAALRRLQQVLEATVLRER